MKNKHILLLPLVILGLLTGILAGWIRIGWNFPMAGTMGEHGAYMVGGFLGTLICLERTVNYPNRLALIVPAVNSLSIIFLLAGYSLIAYIFLLAGGIGLTIVYLKLYAKHKNFYLLLLMSGALCYVIGNALLIKSSFYPPSVMWWIAFLFLTITGERLEFSRFLNISGFKQTILVILLLLFVAGIMSPFHSVGGYILAISMIGCSVWLLKYDMAKHSLKKPGQTFYNGVLLITAYIWLGITGLFMAYGSYFGLLYDAALHTFFLGFVFSMIFAHAPVILPAVLRLRVNLFSPTLYIWFVFLQATLLLRISGVFSATAPYKQLAGLLNGIAIIGFFINMAILRKLAVRKLTFRDSVRAILPA
jgi:hypothetical protein